MSRAKPADLRQAAGLIQQYGLAPAISAKVLVAAAKENAKSLPETLQLVARLQMGGQGIGPAPIAQEIAETTPSRSR